MKYKKYPSYKDSGVEWLGEVPEDWEMWKVSHAFNSVGSGTTPTSNNELYYNGHIPWITTGELRENIISSTKKMLTTKAVAENSSLKLFPKGSIAIAMYGATIGRLGKLGIDATTNQACCVITNSKVISNEYLYYWLMGNKNEIINLAYGGGQPNISQDTILNLKISAPILVEQKQIVNFLDKATAKIDTLIEKQTKQIELLKEKRQAVISHAVTKGVNPNVPMKNSGVEWLGVIPEHWEVIQIKRLSSVGRGASPRPIDNPIYFNEEGEYAWVRIADVSKTKGYLNTTLQQLSKLGSSLSVKINPGELFISIAGTVGKPCISNIKACIHDGFVYFPHLKNKYIKLLYRIFEAGECYGGLGKMGTQLNLNTETIGSISISIPPDYELVNIIKYIDDKTSKIDTLIEKSNKSIELLKEKRTALISACVTGKIDVRELV